MQSAVNRLDVERSDSLVAGDIMLPTQFWAPGDDPRTEPEKRLMAAVLEEAVATLLNRAGDRSHEGSQLMEEARRWFASDERSGTFAFATICDVLGLDASCIRQALAAKLAEYQRYIRRRIQAGRGRHRVRSPTRRERRVA